MSNHFVTATGTLSSAVADGATFTTTYPARPAPAPTGQLYSPGDFLNAGTHQLVMGGTSVAFVDDFSIAFTNLTTITITNKSGGTWAAGTTWAMALELGGRPVFRTQNEARGTGKRMPRMLSANLVQVNLGAPIASSDNGIMVSSSPGAGALTFGGALVSGGVAVFDVPRNIIVTSGGNDSGITFTITGKDEYGATMTETITGANIGVAAGKKAFASVTTTPTKSGASAGTVKIGHGEVLGLPVFLPALNASYLLKELQDGVVATAGAAVAGIRTSGGSTATTGDVRGTYDPNAACDGAKVFQLILALPNPTDIGILQA